MKRASIFKRKKQFFVHALSETTDGVWMYSEPWLALPESTDDSQLENAIRVALDGTKMGVPHPAEWAHVLDPLLTLAGVKGWTTFMRGATCVEIDADGGHLTLLPTTNRGPREGFIHETSKQIVLDEGSPELAAIVRGLLTPSQ
jgi:hypothetical protein